jgi:hypothetical protein
VKPTGIYPSAVGFTHPTDGSKSRANEMGSQAFIDCAAYRVPIVRYGQFAAAASDHFIHFAYIYNALISKFR